MKRLVSACSVALGTTALAMPPSAPAATPVGTCTKSYQPYLRDQFAALGATPDQQQLFAAIFDAVNKNGDAIVCFKFYPNGLHDIHSGNLVDNNAAPHS
jgi:hypothetical protein